MIAAGKHIFFRYCEEVGTLTLFALFSLSLEFFPPNIRIPTITDKTIDFPFSQHEVISAIMLPLFNMGLPTFVILSIGLITRFKGKNMFTLLLGKIQGVRTLLMYFGVFELGLYFTVCMAFLFTNLLKSPIGKLRPDFLSRCLPDRALLPLIKCTGNAKLITEGRRSFPSGHASSTFGGLGFISFFLSDQFKIFGSGRSYKLVIFLIPFILASLISISRIVDNRHHLLDVIAGSCIGIFSSIFVYFYFFPALSRNNDNIPQSPTNSIAASAV